MSSTSKPAKLYFRLGGRIARLGNVTDPHTIVSGRGGDYAAERAEEIELATKAVKIEKAEQVEDVQTASGKPAPKKRGRPKKAERQEDE